MTNTVTEQNVNKMLLAKLIRDNHVTSDDVHYCVKCHRDEIYRMKHIFDRKDERDQRLAQTALGVVAQERANEVMAYFAKVYGIAQVKNLYGNFPKDDVELIVAAFHENPSFFSYVQDVCDDIKEMIEREQSETTQNDYRIEWKTGVVIFIFQSAIEGHDKADPEGFETVFENAIVYNDIGGKFYLKGNEQKQVYLEFIFDKYQDAMPFELELSFTTICDHKEHSIVIPADAIFLRDRETDFTAIRSGKVNGVDCSSGIEANYKVSLKLLPNP